MTSLFKHNKKRNCSLVYEFLVRRLTSQILDNDKRGYDVTRAIIERYYSKESPISKEYEIFDVIRNTNVTNKIVARSILREAVFEYKNLDHNNIEIKKNNIIKDINLSLGKNFFSEHRIPEYKLLATIHMYLSGNRKGKTIVERSAALQLEDAIVSYMTTRNYTNNNNNYDKRVDDLACVIATKKFSERYDGILLTTQKIFLENYTKFSLSDDDSNLRLLLNDEKTRMLLMIRKAKSMNEFSNDKIMRGRLDEAENKLRSMGENLISENVDEFVQEIMLFQKLEGELNSNE